MTLTEIEESIKKINFTPDTVSFLRSDGKPQLQVDNQSNGRVLCSGNYNDATSPGLAAMLAEALIPWRKGPFQIDGFFIDAEWRSDFKWNRLLPDLPNLSGKTVADVGCNNGYYLFRIAEAGAVRTVGFDPTLKYKLQYELIAAHAPERGIEYHLAGWQDLAAWPCAFDVIFLMGVNYHASDTTEVLHACKKALKEGGLLVLESVVVPTDALLEIFPHGKYAGIGGVYAIPSPAALADDLANVGFKNIFEQHVVRMTREEQRSTLFSPQKSLEDFLNEDGSSIEGYPPLYRAAFFATKNLE
ncbi:MAG TPA: tRNA 5-methoxyuridine(34)/uridine 5-oxyacetic acid(34) synthase CmoB [Turneriella sp.]|nr:tRNA 5-methoxyuridine(34)/uridine 5-oxyacetic acid(34) synthase CmoB [Turneriella sp.]